MTYRELRVAVALLLSGIASTAASASFSVEPATGRASGGDPVQLVFTTPAEAETVKSVQFGGAAARGLQRRNHVITVETPIYTGRGEASEGGFRVTIGVNGHPTNVVFTYLSENAPENKPPEQDREKEAPRERDAIAMTIDPPYGMSAGGGWVSIRISGRKAACNRPEVVFEKIAVSLQPAGAMTFRASIPAMEIGQEQSVRPVNVSLRCNGSTVASGSFLYINGSRRRQTTSAWIGLVMLSVILAALGLGWRMRSLEKRLSSAIAAISSLGTTPAAPDYLPVLRRILIQLEILTPQKEAAGPALGESWGGEPKTESEPSTHSIDGIESVEELSDHDLMTEQRPAAVLDTTQQKRASKQIPAVKVRPQSNTGAGELTAIWNDAYAAKRNDEEFYQLVSSGMPGKYDFRSESGVIVVTLRGAEFAWVVPSMRLMFHRPAIREFFEVRSESRGTTTLICPAMMPKDIDINGYTAGQISRGIIER